MEQRLILFDVDGTLVDTAGAGRVAIVEAFRAVFPRDGVEEAAGRVRFQGKTDPVIVEDLGARVGLSTEAMSERLQAFWTAYLDALQAVLSRPDPRRRTLPGVVPLLDALEARPGVHLGLLTGNIEAGARAKLGAFDLNRYFPDGGFASDHSDRREIARIAREKLARVGRASFVAERTVVVGDTEHDVDCARANGYRAVAIASGWVPRETLEAARPDALLDDFTDLPASLAALGL